MFWVIEGGISGSFTKADFGRMPPSIARMIAAHSMPRSRMSTCGLVRYELITSARSTIASASSGAIGSRQISVMSATFSRAVRLGIRLYA